jgi:hypothetical protein
MNAVQIWGAVLAIVALASCAPRPVAEPPPPPVQPPVRPELPPPPPAAADWRDMPLSPGGWSYSASAGISTATFGLPGHPSFIVRCERSREITLLRVGADRGAALTLRTSYGARSLAARPWQGPQAALGATLAASDPVLDALAFSRGRFTVEAESAPMLVIPAWPEPARVVEDCRA